MHPFPLPFCNCSILRICVIKWLTLHASVVFQYSTVLLLRNKPSIIISKSFMEFKTYTTSTGETLLYTGNPDLQLLETLAHGVGDVWHSSFEQGFKNAFSTIQYQTHIAWWYTNDFDNLNECVSWRI